MKTAISIPDTLFMAAEQFAHEHGLSRSELFARAIQLYLETHQHQAIMNALNNVYEQETSTLDPALAAAQSRIIPKEDW